MYLTGEAINRYMKEASMPYRSVKKDYNEKKNVNSELCSICCGKCCRNYGCHFSPDDFKEISFEALKNEIEKGYIAIEFIDHWTTYSLEEGYILRSRHRGGPIVDTHGDSFGETCCILLGKDGCKLEYEKRPSGGKLLIPQIERCYQEYPLKDCVYEWMPHQEVILKLIEYFEHKEIPCSL